MGSSTRAYPVQVDGRLDAPLSRWLWLVKWLLAIPHYVVLAFLWLAFVVLSVVAFFAILFTRRYPRGIFDFNVGVLRWTWRVGFYTYSALGTDRYPPFTLAEVEEYPAHLEIRYPERLSRWLPFVKWLLALPHLLLVGIFLGGAGAFTWGFGDGAWRGAGPGLIGLLVLIAAVILLFTGRYPREIFDFALGLNRWVLRVAGYAALMTDRYPPFRLDSGESEPARDGEALEPAEPEGEPSARPSHWTGGRIALVVVGSLLALVGLGALGGGGFGLWTHTTQRDSQGYLMTSSERFASDGYAIATRSIHLSSDVPGFLYGRGWLGTVRIRGESSDATRALFIGIARQRDVDSYLARVAYTELVDVHTNPFRALYRQHTGGRPGTAPVRERFWVATAAGSGTQTVSWHVKSGSWAVVAMRPGGARSVAANMAVGADLPALLGVSIGLLAFGLVCLAGATALIYLGAREPRRASATAA